MTTEQVKDELYRLRSEVNNYTLRIPENKDKQQKENYMISIDIAIKSLDMWDKVIKIIDEEREFAYADFERYKVEYLGQEWEDVLDSIPQDDYRYGMERCIEIIEKYKKEIEE